MTRRGLFGLICAGLMGALGQRPAAQARDRHTRNWRKWTVFYGWDLDVNEFRGYDLIVLDPSFRGSLAAVSQWGASVLGYISVGEVRKTTDLYDVAKSASALLPESPYWRDVFYVDVRISQWRSAIVERAVELVKVKGFNGVFLDTLDSPPFLEATDTVSFGGMGRAAVGIVRDIRRALPHALIVVNRGYLLLPELVEFLDGVVAESLITTYSGKGFEWVTPEIVARQLEFLLPAKHHSLPVRILSLDYWDPQENQTIKEIYARERAMGHLPYVSDVLLDKVVPEPAV